MNGKIKIKANEKMKAKNQMNEKMKGDLQANTTSLVGFWGEEAVSCQSKRFNW